MSEEEKNDADVNADADSGIRNQQSTINNGERRAGDVRITKRVKSMYGGMGRELERV